MKLKSLVGLMCLVGCLFYVFSYDDYESPRYVKLAREITAATGKKLEKEKALKLSGTGGAMMNDIQMMMMAFDFYQITNVETARGLLVSSVEEYLSAINANEEIRPYLHNYPFRPENIEIVIYFRSPDGSSVPTGKMNIAATNEGKMYYYMRCPEKLSLEIFYEETYEDALKVIAPRI